jgi:hypothetical protein
MTKVNESIEKFSYVMNHYMELMTDGLKRELHTIDLRNFVVLDTFQKNMHHHLVQKEKKV